jgi:hypothetical protein
MGDRVGPIPGDSGWYPDESPDQAGARKRKKPPARPSDVEPPAEPAEDYYAPSEPDEEG